MNKGIADFQIQVHIEPVIIEGTLGYSFDTCYKTLEYDKRSCGPCTHKTLEIIFDQILQELSQIIEAHSSDTKVKKNDSC